MSVSPRISPAFAAELFSLVAGDRIGGGFSRTVFAFRPDERFVIKFEHRARCFQNVAEYELWNHARGEPRLQRFLAPCQTISACGRVLLQRRTHPVPPQVAMPMRVPAILGDLQRGNWGYCDRRIVCHDYGFNRLEILRAGGMRRVRFEGEA